MGAADIVTSDGIKVDAGSHPLCVLVRCTAGAGGIVYQMTTDEARRLARALNTMADAVEPVREKDGAGTVTCLWGQPSLSANNTVRGALSNDCGLQASQNTWNA